MYALRSYTMMFKRPGSTYGVLAAVIGLCLVITIFITWIIGIGKGLPLSAGEAGTNTTIIAAPMGMFITIQAIAMNRYFAMALAFGSSRRDFWAGNALSQLVMAGVYSLACIFMLVIERATNWWWIGARCFDVSFISGDGYVMAFARLFLFTFAMLSLGAFFGSVYRSFGTVATWIAAVGVVLIHLAVIAWLAYDWTTWMPIITGPFVATWGMVLYCAIIAVLGTTASLVANRKSAL